MLESGLSRLHQQLKQTHWEVYEKIRQRFSDYFDDLVHLKDTRCDLIPVTSTTSISALNDSPFFGQKNAHEGTIEGDEVHHCADDVKVDELENGFKIVLTDASLSRSSSSNILCSSGDSEREEEEGKSAGQGQGQRRVQGLSGGQQALLGLALVFSCALSTQRSPVYFLDEVQQCV
jgi:chromosome segregation ATPase